MQLLKAIEESEVNDLARARFFVQMLHFLKVYEKEHRHVLKDAARAAVTACLFFPNIVETSVTPFFDTEGGKAFKESPLMAELLDPAKRAQTLPDRRSVTSAIYRPKAFWKALQRKSTVDPTVGPYRSRNYPPEWDKVVRPLIAKRKFRSYM
jgi:hypothetical protein